ncbi:MAG: AAA family ATPase [Actinomycetota bacterium]|nr:AAA family ATPase [Actinomycetota bacterium]
MARQPTATAPAVETLAGIFEAVVANVSRVIQGKEQAIRLALVGIAAEGHILVEDVPGVGKTSLAKALARSFDLTWSRIQFTPDLLPSDVTGVSVYDRAERSFTFRPGGVFANVVLADEINRASPRTQAALLESMQERQVTLDGVTRPLPSPFLVIATQNPTEHQGTYPLPESQLDRFLLRLRMGYPARDAELAMLDTSDDRSVDDLAPVAGPASVTTMVDVATHIHVAPAIKGYIVDLATATRAHPGLALGMSPRAVLALQRAARALAASVGRSYVVPDDVKALIGPVLEHRVTASPEAALGGRDIADLLDDAIRSVSVPPGRSGSR